MKSSRFVLPLPLPLPLALVVIAALCSAPASMLAQTADTVFIRAQRMVTEGQGDAGRAVVQRELDAAPPGSPRFVEALFWRASLAATAADAERDYRRIIIEFPISPRAGDALLRMGQLEMARGERDKAIEHFRRLALEHPTHVQRARASYWSAQLLFQAGSEQRACATLADARQYAAETDVELRNQIDYYTPRCAITARDSAIGTRPSATAPSIQAPTPVVETPAPAPIAAPGSEKSGQAFTVQVAAYRSRAAADKQRRELAARGFQVRTAHLAGLWMVRVGEYATRQAAEAARIRMRTYNIRGIVVEMEPR